MDKIVNSVNAHHLIGQRTEVCGMNYDHTCELKVCTTKKPENPSVFLTLPVAHELSVLCMI